MNRRRLAGIAAILFILAVIIFMPLRMIVGGQDVVARKVEGIIWDGSIRDLRAGRVALGDVNARLLFPPLFLGRAKILLSRGDAQFAPGLSGWVTRRIGGFSVDEMRATLPVATLFAPLPVENVELQDFSVRFVSGRCAEASGNVRMTSSGFRNVLTMPSSKPAMNSDCAVRNDMPSNKSSATHKESVFTPQKITKRSAGWLRFMAPMLARSIDVPDAAPRYVVRARWVRWLPLGPRPFAIL